MSGNIGDKARFNRVRKQNIRRRARQRALFGSLAKPAPLPSSQSQPKEKSE